MLLTCLLSTVPAIDAVARIALLFLPWIIVIGIWLEIPADFRCSGSWCKKWAKSESVEAASHNLNQACSYKIKRYNQ